MKVVDCDVLVVGSGGAALRAAIAAKEAENGLSVLVATKGKPGKSGVTANSCSDRMAFHVTLPTTEPGGEDAWTYHADDIYRIGGKVSDKSLADVLAKKAAEAYEYLDRLGVPFVKKDGCADQFVTDGSAYARACYTGPRTAVHIEKALVQHFQTLGIGVLEYAMVVRLIHSGDRLVGAVAIDTREKDPARAAFVIRTPAIILATGGGGMIYEHNVFPGGMTGDGFAMAYEAGAELVNMEFVQIGIASTKTKFNCSGSMMRAIPRLVNSAGEEFLAQYFPTGTSAAEIANTVFLKGASWPVSYEHKTHIIDIALYKEWKAGRRTFLDYGRNPQGFSFEWLTAENQARYRREMTLDLGEALRNKTPLERLREINQPSLDWFAEYGIDLIKGDLIEVAACAQHFQGGIKINSQARTMAPGVWAAGETAGGQHGANRPGGNALLDCQVFGRIAGEDAVACVKTSKSKPPQAAELSADELLLSAAVDGVIGEITESAGRATNAVDFRRALQVLTEAGAGIVRTEAGLRDSLSKLETIKSDGFAMGEKSPAYFFENKSLLLTAEAVLRASLLRDESRGPHLRFARYEDNVPLERKEGIWEKYIVIHRDAGAMALDVREPAL
ncbi:MAG: fumarate reductase/succinate dehydrogenase flavoprotein domain protein [Firmicutes bacterium]|nr:fumarate reductase/succinate dehydrogenase flavoprotein domain protein [Bacillota bacterium]